MSARSEGSALVGTGRRRRESVSFGYMILKREERSRRTHVDLVLKVLLLSEERLVLLEMALMPRSALGELGDVNVPLFEQLDAGGEFL